MNDSNNEAKIGEKKGTALFLLMMLLLFTIAATTLINPAAAFLQSLPTITIHSDGAIEPKTDYIRRDGNVYTLTADIIREYAIRIQCSNIIFDGKGHTINGSQSSYFGYANIGLTLDPAPGPSDEAWLDPALAA
ncbi:MAG: hypothetical protein QXZ70_07045, partial [Candidatus Bathyarchaeia archaeon]